MTVPSSSAMFFTEEDRRAGQLIAVVPDLRAVVAISTNLDAKKQTNMYLQGEDLLPMINDVVLSRLE